MTTLITVLKGGGRYDATWVARLAGGIRRHAPAFERIVCLTDQPVAVAGVETIPLRHAWSAWWAKMEAFRPGLSTGPTLLCDLDTVLTAQPMPSRARPRRDGGLFPRGAPLQCAAALVRGRARIALHDLRGRPRPLDEPRILRPVPNAVHGDQVVIDHLLRRSGRQPDFIQRLHPGLLDFYDPRRDFPWPGRDLHRSGEAGYGDWSRACCVDA